MIAPDTSAKAAWHPLDRAAHGLIYGAIMVLSLLMAAGTRGVSPFQEAGILFGSVLAVTWAKAFAEMVAHAIETGERMLTRRAIAAALRHSLPTLLVANVPALLFVAAGKGWIALTQAVLWSQSFCVLILIMFGLRVGWVVGHNLWLPVAGAAFAGGVGIALAAMKYAIH